MLIVQRRRAAAGGYDTDAQSYITAVEAADGQSLETAVKDAINAFVVDCKADGIWTAIKASCILAGARTLSGALVPLAGTAPTSSGFVSGDYNRKTGLRGGQSKYIDSNRNNNADPQNSKHISVYVTQTSGDGALLLDGGFAGNTGETSLGLASVVYAAISKQGWQSTSFLQSNANNAFVGANRSSSSEITVRFKGSSQTLTMTSQAPYNRNIRVFNETSNSFPFTGRMAFYSIGETLNIASYESRVNTLIAAIAAAIP
jgi:hypothetical protein